MGAQVWRAAEGGRDGMRGRASYVPISYDDLQVTAHIIGPQSAATQALANLEARHIAGQLPICLSVRKATASGGTFLVFDMRDPPDFLPAWVQRECADAVLEIERKAASMA